MQHPVRSAYARLWACSVAQSPSRISLPRKGCRVGLPILLFEACSGERRGCEKFLKFRPPPNQITTWKAQLENGAADIFSPNGTATVQPAIDVKSLHAKIGELTLENDS
jgi:transposase